MKNIIDTDTDVLSLKPPYHYLSASPSLLAQPQHFASFSYGDDRELLVDKDHRDQSLRWYRQPMLGLDLRFAYERCTWRSEDLVEGIDGLLDWFVKRKKAEVASVRRSLTVFCNSLYHSILQGLMDTERPERSQALTDMLGKTAVVTWRGMITKILTCVYEESQEWEMNAMLLNGTIYLEEHKADKYKTRHNNQDKDPKQQLMTYFGYSFESYCTTEDPNAPQPTSAAQYWSGDVNTNVQWGSVVQTSLGDVSMVLGGEVDCVQEGAGIDQPLQTRDFIELKTNLVIENERDEVKFERYKLLKHYVQSLLLGVPSIIIGFRQPNGILAGLQSFETLDLPNLVAGKPHAWHASSCLVSGHEILSYIVDRITGSQLAKAHESMPESNPAPVFRIKFTPQPVDNMARVTTRRLSPSEIEDVLANKSRTVERIGFMPAKYVREIRKRFATRPQSSFDLNY